MKSIRFREGLAGMSTAWASRRNLRKLSKLTKVLGAGGLAGYSRMMLRSMVNPLSIGIAAGMTAYELPGAIKYAASGETNWDKAMQFRRLARQQAKARGMDVTTENWINRGVGAQVTEQQKLFDVPTTLQYARDKETWNRRTAAVTEGMLMSKYFRTPDDLKAAIVHDYTMYEGRGNFIRYQASLNATNRVYVAPKTKHVVARTVAGG
jgi:hypothetical protein